MLLSEPLHAGLGSDEIGDEGGLSFRLQMLLLVACGMLVPSSSDALIRHLDAAVDGGALGPLPCVGVLPEFERLPVPVARALSVAVANPMLQVGTRLIEGATDMLFSRPAPLCRLSSLIMMAQSLVALEVEAEALLGQGPAKRNMGAAATPLSQR